MAKGIAITEQLVALVKEYLASPKYDKLTYAEVAKLTGTSATTVCRIAQGEYDDLSDSNCKVVLHYEELQHMFNCERIVKELLECSKLSDTVVDEDKLYFPRNLAHAIINKYVPQEVQQRIEELKIQTQ